MSVHCNGRKKISNTFMKNEDRKCYMFIYVFFVSMKFKTSNLF
jgi:hypothetical protein